MWRNTVPPQMIHDIKDEAKKLVLNEKYNFKNQPERLKYIGYNFSGNGYWHQFEEVGKPNVVWSEMQDSDLHMIELTQK